MKRHLSLLLAVMIFSAPSVWAQVKALPPVLKSTVQSVAGRVVERKLRLPQLSKTEAAYWRGLQRSQDFEAAEISLDFYFELSPSSAPSFKMLYRNAVLQEKMLENFLTREFDLSKKLSVPVLDVVAESAQYAEYIPSSARVIMLGEVHEVDWMIREVEEAVSQYQKAHPDRSVYYASEFVDATPGEVYLLRSREDVERLVRKRPYYRGVTFRMIARGVNVVGLENPELSTALVEHNYRAGFSDETLAWRTISPAGVEERNQYWSDSIRRILRSDPSAVVFVHAGMAHTNYNHPASLPWQLKEFRPYVVEFTDNGLEAVNELLDTYAPVYPAMAAARKLVAENAGKRVRFVRRFPSKRMAVAVGCDLNLYPLRLSER